MNVKKFLLSFIFLSVLSTTANAATFKLDSIYTTVSFRVKHLMGYAVGSFTKFDGAIQLNDGNDAVTAVNGTVDMTTIDTRHKDRDNDLRSARFFDVEKFPTMTFKSTKIEKNKITGDLTLHGVTKKVTLDYAFWGLAKDQRGKTKTAVSISGVVNRKDFGIVYNIKTDDGTWLLGDEVELRIELHGILK